MRSLSPWSICTQHGVDKRRRQSQHLSRFKCLLREVAGTPSTPSSVQAPRSHTAAVMLQGTGVQSSTVLSDGHMHPEGPMLVATLAQVLLQELQGTGPGLTTATEPAAAQLHRHGQQCWDLC